MAGSLVSLASKTVTDVGTFLRESASSNSLKYVAEKSKNHVLYIPAVEVEVQDEDGTVRKVRSVVALSGKVHEWSDSAGKYHATICMKDKLRKADDGVTLLNDGSCPICDRVDDAWNIYNYRKDMEEEICTLTGEQRKKHMETALSTFGDEKKAKKANDYMYILLVQFKTNDNAEPILNDKGMPEYALKVARFSHSKTEKLNKQIANAGGDLPDSEWMFSYGDDDNPKILAGQVVMSPVFPNKRITNLYPAVKEAIMADVEKFDWEGLEDAFKEWKGMTTAETQKLMDTSFEEWDKYNERLKTDPDAKYLEYSEVVPTANPSLQIPPAPQLNATAIPNVPQIPNIAGAVQSQPVQMPNVGVAAGTTENEAQQASDGTPAMTQQQVNNQFTSGQGISI